MARNIRHEKCSIFIAISRSSLKWLTTVLLFFYALLSRNRRQRETEREDKCIVCSSSEFRIGR